MLSITSRIVRIKLQVRHTRTELTKIKSLLWEPSWMSLLSSNETWLRGPAQRLIHTKTRSIHDKTKSENSTTSLMIRRISSNKWLCQMTCTKIRPKSMLTEGSHSRMKWNSCEPNWKRLSYWLISSWWKRDQRVLWCLRLNITKQIMIGSSSCFEIMVTLETLVSLWWITRVECVTLLDLKHMVKVRFKTKSRRTGFHTRQRKSLIDTGLRGLRVCPKLRSTKWCVNSMSCGETVNAEWSHESRTSATLRSETWDDRSLNANLSVWPTKLKLYND